MNTSQAEQHALRMLAVFSQLKSKCLRLSLWGNGYPTLLVGIKTIRAPLNSH